MRKVKPSNQTNALATANMTYSIDGRPAQQYELVIPQQKNSNLRLGSAEQFLAEIESRWVTNPRRLVFIGHFRYGLLSAVTAEAVIDMATGLPSPYVFDAVYGEIGNVMGYIRDRNGKERHFVLDDRGYPIRESTHDHDNIHAKFPGPLQFEIDAREAAERAVSEHSQGRRLAYAWLDNPRFQNTEHIRFGDSGGVKNGKRKM